MAEAPREVAFGPELPASLADAIEYAITLDAGPTEKRAAADAIASYCGITISALIYFGSGSAGWDDPTDIDLLVLSADGSSGGIWGNSESTHIDCHIVPIDEAIEDTVLNWAHLADGRVLVGDDRVHGWLDAIADAVSGPWVWTESECLRDAIWAQRMVTRIERRLRSDPLSAALNEATLLSGLKDIDAQVQRRAPSSASSWARSVTDEMREALDVYLAGPRPDPQGLRNILDLIQNPRPEDSP